MKEPVITSKGSRSRRAIATLTWSGLTIVAAVLWYGRLNGTIRSVTTEPIALLLSAYAAFSSIFAWMLFSPNRRSSEESPVLFFAGGIALLPPCIISFCIMPPDSPLRGWLTLGVFVMTVIAVMSPVPEELFAVPRDRSTYLQPLTDALFARLKVSDFSTGFDHLQSAETLARDLVVPYSTSPVSAPSAWKGTARDPWQDPFSGTGIRPVQPGTAKAHRDRETRPQRSGVDDEAKEAKKDEVKKDVVTSKPAGHSAKPLDEMPARTAASSAHSPLPVLPAKPESKLSVSELPKLKGAHGHGRPAAAFGFRTPNVSEELSRTAYKPVLLNDEPEVAEQEASTTDDSLTFERTRDEYGGEMIEGTIQVRFETGQRRASLHVPFSPPMPGIPEVECESVGNESLRLKIPVRQTYGIRIEARRSDTSTPLETEIGFAAVYSPQTRHR